MFLSLAGVAAAYQLQLQRASQQQLVAVHQPAPLRLAATPAPAPSVTPTPAPTAAPTPAPTTRPIVTAAPTRPPLVTPAPNSRVSGLTPAASSTPAPTATPAPGMGEGVTLANVAYWSQNWSGYLSTAGHFTGVSGSWTVPHVTGNGTSTTADAAWVGIGGVTSSDLIQVGTDEAVSKSGHASYSAFYELLPAPAVTIPGMTIAAGDVMSADIHLVGTNQWSIELHNLTQHEDFAITVSYTSSQSSAEWIEEDPSYADGTLVPFNSFTTVPFTNALAARNNGASQTMKALNAQAVMLVDAQSKPLVTPTVIGSDGMSFSAVHN